jgi:CII-binding regulator of phage lambda lysogenization HflD
MTPPTNSNEAQVAILEARMDGRMSSMETTFANFVQLMDERHRASEARMDRMEAMLAEIRADIRSLRTTIVVTAITSVLAAVLGISAVNASLYSNMRATFEMGKEEAAARAQIVRSAEELIALKKRMDEEQNKKTP